MDLPGFWMDIGQPKDYLSGTCLYLSYLSSQKSKIVTDPAQNPWVHQGNVMVDPVSFWFSQVTAMAVAVA